MQGLLLKRSQGSSGRTGTNEQLFLNVDKEMKRMEDELSFFDKWVKWSKA